MTDTGWNLPGTSWHRVCTAHGSWLEASATSIELC